MAYIYCESCDEGMDAPTDREILTEKYECHFCGADNSHRIDDDHKKYAFSRIFDRLEALESNNK